MLADSRDHRGSPNIFAGPTDINASVSNNSQMFNIFAKTASELDELRSSKDKV